MTIRDEFMIQRQGKTFVLYAGLLEEAHERGLLGIETELVQIPSEENGSVAIARAKVYMEDGPTFEEHGDASPGNVSRNIAPHLIRMAFTRAKARALRDAINIGVTALEELGSDADDNSGNEAASRRGGNNGAQAQREGNGGSASHANRKVSAHELREAWKDIEEAKRPDWETVWKTYQEEPSKVLARLRRLKDHDDAKSASNGGEEAEESGAESQKSAQKSRRR